MKEILDNPDLLRWLLAQSAALVVALLWIWSLKNQNSRLWRQVTALTKRNEHLSDTLLDRVERGSLERSRNETERMLLEKLSSRDR